VLSKVMGDKYKSEDNRKMTSEEWFATFEKKLAG